MSLPWIIAAGAGLAIYHFFVSDETKAEWKEEEKQCESEKYREAETKAQAMSTTSLKMHVKDFHNRVNLTKDERIFYSAIDAELKKRQDNYNKYHK